MEGLSLTTAFDITLILMAIVVTALAFTRRPWQASILRLWQALWLPKSRAYDRVRIFLAFCICFLALLSVLRAVELERLKCDLLDFLQGTPGTRLKLDPGFLLQHPIVLSAFTLFVTVVALLNLFLSKSRTRAVMVAALALVVLLVQLLVVAPGVALPLMQLRDRLQLGSF
jgi:hypothetical protein